MAVPQARVRSGFCRSASAALMQPRNPCSPSSCTVLLALTNAAHFKNSPLPS